VEELHARADGDEICGDVEAVGHDEGDEEHGEDRSPGPVESPDGQLAEPCAGRKRRAVTDLLYRGHQRQGKEGGPQERQAVLGTGLGVGSDPGGIVIGGACHQPRSHGPQVLTPDSARARLGEIELGCRR